MSSDVIVHSSGMGTTTATGIGNPLSDNVNANLETTSPGLNESFGSTISSSASTSVTAEYLTNTSSQTTDMAEADDLMDNNTSTHSGYMTSATATHNTQNTQQAQPSSMPFMKSRTTQLQRGMDSPGTSCTLGPNTHSSGTSTSTSSTSKAARADILPTTRPPQADMFDAILQPADRVDEVDGQVEIVYQVAPGLEHALLMPLFENGRSGGRKKAASKSGTGTAKTGRSGMNTGSGTRTTGPGTAKPRGGASSARKGHTARCHANVQGARTFHGTQGRSRIVKLKVPMGNKQKKVYEDMLAAAHSRKPKIAEVPMDDEGDDNDEDFEVGRRAEKKLKEMVGAIERPVRSTRQKDSAIANKRQKEVERAFQAIDKDMEEQEKQYWGKPKRASVKKGRTATKAILMPVQPELKKTPNPRPVRAKKRAQKASNADESPKPTPAKRGRAAKNTAGVKKTSPKPATARKIKSAATPKSKSKAAQSLDVAMQDVDEVIGVPSPASSSSLSDASSFVLQSSASSHPSPEPADGHLIDEAEKEDLLENSSTQQAIVQNPNQDTPIIDNRQQLITSNMGNQARPTAQTIQSSDTQLVAVQRSLQPNKSARRNQAQSSGAYRLVHNSNNPAVGNFLPCPQAQFMPPVANLDPRLSVTDTPGWVGAQTAMFQQIAAQNLVNHGILIPLGPQNNGQMVAPDNQEAPHNQQLVRVEPRIMGEPPVWADKRQQLCETLNYYRAYQSGVYQNAGIIYGMLVDAESRPWDVFTEEVIITRCGGGRGGVDVNGHRAQAVHQQSSPIGLGFQRAKVNKLPIVVIAGSKYRNSVHTGDWLPHRYNILAHFQVTDVWLELNDGFQTYCCRMEKINLHEYSWWATQPYLPGSYDAPHAPTYLCRRCRSGSKVQYAQGWVCLNINCLSYFNLVDGQTGFEAILTNLTYGKEFLTERTPYSGTRALAPLAPPLITREDMIIHARSGTEEVFTKGIVCPKCRCCSRRTNFRKWTCENLAGCDFEYELPVRTLTAAQAQPVLYEGLKYPFISPNIDLVSVPVGHFDVDRLAIPGVDGHIIGYVFHFKSNGMVNALPYGPDDLLREMQEKDFGLMRRPVRQKGCAGEILTSHYASNWGAPYKFVVAQQSKPFTEAPEVIVKALKKMTWAGEAGQKLTPDGAAFQQFNELLSIGYFENTAIGYHDDGEKELGPTIATLSLGSQAEMSLRPKRRAPESIGRAMNNQRGTRAEELKILLNHGDIVIMHGEGVQKFYEHAVTPHGTLRYALTCRTILPEKLENDAERAEAARLAKLPDGHEAWDYDGYQILDDEDTTKTKSKQIVTALQRTLNDLHTMVQHSTAEELAQVEGVDEVIGAYRRVMATATPTSAAPVQTEASDAEVNSYVMVSADPVGEDAAVEDELVGAVEDLNMDSSSQTSSS